MAACARCEDAELVIERRPHPCRARRERRRQVDADQDHGRRRRSPTRAACCSTAGPVAFASPAAAHAAGIACIFQELSLIPDLSVADNIAISNPPRRFGLIDRRAQRRMAEAALARAGAEDIHPLALVKDLSLSRRQMVEIAKALAREPRILILDEATSALTAADVTKIYAVLKRLRAEGLALVYISHRMHEIAELADECTVFRNGRSVATLRGRHEDRQRGRRADDRPRVQRAYSRRAGARAAEADATCRGSRCAT